MSRFLDRDEASAVVAAIESGAAKRVGGCEPCREMKGYGWRVVRWNGRLYASVIDGAGHDLDTIEEIEEREIEEYGGPSSESGIDGRSE